MSVSYIILYGYDKTTFLQYISQENTKVIILEPRSLQIDQFHKEKEEFKNKNYKFISKAITKDLKATLYKKDNVYYLNKRIEDYEKREDIFGVQLSHLIEQEAIQNITNIVFNIPIGNLDDTLLDFSDWAHIISKLTLHINSQFKVPSTFIKKEQDENFLYYDNKNINIELPRICVYSINPKMSNPKEFIKMIKQYDMDFVIDHPIENSIEIVKDFSIIENMGTTPTSIKYTTNDTVEKLIKIFKKDYYDIIIQFNTSYFSQKKNFQLLYPTNDNTLYIHKQTDLIYGTGKCMFKLYQTMCSLEYKEHMNKKSNERPKVYKLFEKRYFYEYLNTVFQIIEIK